MQEINEHLFCGSSSVIIKEIIVTLLSSISY